MPDVRSRKVRVVSVDTRVAVALRPVAGLRLRGQLHVRGRRPAGRAPGPGPHPRPAHAGRAGGRRRAARAHRPRRPGRRSRPSCRPSTTGGGPATPTRPTTCCAGSATSPSSELRARSTERLRRRRWSRTAGPSRCASPARSRLIAAEDAGRYRDALGVQTPPGLPDAFLEPVDDPLGQLVRRWARTHGPFHAERAGARFGLPAERGRGAAGRPGRGRHAGAGRVPPRRHRAGVVRRRGAAHAAPAVAGRPAPGGRAHRRRRPGPLPAGVAGRGRRRPAASTAPSRWWASSRAWPSRPAVLERDVLPARVRDYSPRLLDELLAAGEVMWVGAGPLGRDDGRVVLLLRGQAPLLRPAPPSASGPSDAGARAPPRGAGAHGAPASSGSWAASTTTSHARRPVGPGVGRRGHQRLLRRRAGPRRRQAAGSQAAKRVGGRPRLGILTALGPPEGPGPVVAGRAPAWATSPRRSAARPGRRPARAPRRAHPGGGAGRGRARRVRRRVPGAAGHGGVGPRPAGLLRRRPGRRPVRPARRRRPPPRRRRDAPTGALAVLLAATDPANPYGLSLPWPRQRPAAGWPAPTSSCSTAWPRSTWRRVARASSPCAPSTAVGGRTPSPPSASSGPGGRLRRLSVERSTDRAGRPSCKAAGFVPTPKGVWCRSTA